MAEVAALVGDPGRASMLEVMMDGRAHTAGELAAAAGVTAATASGHLAKLKHGGLAEVSVQGRHRYYRLASVEVARMLEGIMVVTAEPPVRARATPRVPAELRDARTCYDHLAGRLGVSIADTLLSDGAVRMVGDKAEVTERGRTLLAAMDIDLETLGGGGKRLMCRPCLDWSERRPHLAGVLGTALLGRFLALRWIDRMPGNRAVRVTTLGRTELYSRFGFRSAHVASGASLGLAEV
jgi:DNA-binding transcriptional ArsR family regulator